MLMDTNEKKLLLQNIDMALEDVNKIIDTMEEKCYPKEQINEFYKKRWELWNEQYRIKNA